MKGPHLAALRQRIPNKYLLVAVASKRARQLMGGATPLLNDIQGKAVTVALQEIANEAIVPVTESESQEK
ncbi:MAG TPA: DNA-directed RNA polymerase subunit omega [Firmicutes bacterium]|jgi:DNA-directed RNA polymerase subunit omega|nr:DNA-directed RNA polymerase subunit omega [Bacillota bacterium]